MGTDDSTPGIPPAAPQQAGTGTHPQCITGAATGNAQTVMSASARPITSQELQPFSLCFRQRSSVDLASLGEQVLAK